PHCRRGRQSRSRRSPRAPWVVHLGRAGDRRIPRGRVQGASGCGRRRVRQRRRYQAPGLLVGWGRDRRREGQKPRGGYRRKWQAARGVASVVPFAVRRWSFVASAVVSTHWTKGEVALALLPFLAHPVGQSNDICLEL